MITFHCPICPDPMPKDLRENGSILDHLKWAMTAPITEPCGHEVEYEYDKTQDRWLFYIPEELPAQVEEAR